MPIKQYLETSSAKFLGWKRRKFSNNFKEPDKKKRANETQSKQIKENNATEEKRK